MKHNRPRGRPPTGKPRASYHLLVREPIINWLENEKQPNETNGDALERILKINDIEYRKLRKKVDALLAERQQFQLTVNHNYDKEVNQPLQVKRL